MSRLSPFSSFFVLVGLCRPYRAHMLRPLFQGFTPLAISCRPFGAQETVLLLQWQGVPKCGRHLKGVAGISGMGRHLRCRIRSLCRLSPETFPFAENTQLPERATEGVH